MSHRTFLVAAILIFALGITISSAHAETTYIIPDWVKEITGLWVEDKISDNSYLDVITFLIDKKIIIVPLIQELENEVIQLKNENEQLRLELDDSTSQIKAESSALPPTGITAKTDRYSYKKGDIISSTGIVSINVGDTVVWSNDDSAAHTVTSGTPSDGPDGIFDSSIFMSATTFEQVFSESGNYDYFCMVHPWMVGQIQVN